ncbi:MAG: hypothetical protein KGS72_13055 [Cyanobacteria bacterium REEB67]|nr:hypothetical protein [Cyanobacteria bacterium REEB67]
MTMNQPFSIELLKQDADGVGHYRLSLQNQGKTTEESIAIKYQRRSQNTSNNCNRYSEGEIIPQKALENALYNFDRATHRMMLEEGPIEVVPPAQLPNKVKPHKLTFKGKKDENTFLYIVEFETESGTKEYTFAVTGGEIPGVNFDDEFFEDLGQTTQFADALLAAILEFHLARNAETNIR